MSEQIQLEHLSRVDKAILNNVWWGSCTGISEDSGLMGYNAVSLGKRLAACP